MLHYIFFIFFTSGPHRGRSFRKCLTYCCRRRHYRMSVSSRASELKLRWQLAQSCCHHAACGACTSETHTCTCGSSLSDLLVHRPSQRRCRSRVDWSLGPTGWHLSLRWPHSGGNCWCRSSSAPSQIRAQRSWRMLRFSIGLFLSAKMNERWFQNLSVDVNRKRLDSKTITAVFQMKVDYNRAWL